MNVRLKSGDKTPYMVGRDGKIRPSFPYGEIIYDPIANYYVLYIWDPNGNAFDHVQHELKFCIEQAEEDHGILAESWEDVTNSDYIGIEI